MPVFSHTFGSKAFENEHVSFYSNEEKKKLKLDFYICNNIYLFINKCKVYQESHSMTNRIFSLFKFIEMYVNDDDTHEFEMYAMQTNNKNYHMRKLHEANKTVQQNTTKRNEA